MPTYQQEECLVKRMEGKKKTGSYAALCVQVHAPEIHLSLYKVYEVNRREGEREWELTFVRQIACGSLKRPLATQHMRWEKSRAGSSICLCAFLGFSRLM